jgi:LPXTG-site transpeptidase (sortase) family protein
MDARTCRRYWKHLESALWIAGFVLIVTYVVTAVDATWGRERDLARLEVQSPPDTSTWSSSRMEAYRASALVAPDPLIGVVDIPAVGLEVPLYSDTSELHLNRGAGLIPGMARPGSVGNVGVAGHRDGYFRSLRNVKVGEMIEVRTRAARYRYRVSSLTVVSSVDARLLAPTPQPVITLVTCYPFYFVGHAPQRFVVRGVLIQSEET